MKNFSKIVLLLSIFTLTVISCHQQVVNKETSIDKDELYYYRNYHCFDFVKQCELEIVKLIKHDTLIYVSSSQFHGRYEEVHGKLTKINDSIYFVKPFKYLSQSGNGDKPLYMVKDSIYFLCDSAFINSTLKIEYMNGQSVQHKILSTENKFWVNKKYFNEKNERIYLSFGLKNPIINENVELVSKYSDIKHNVVFGFYRDLEDFYIIIKDNQIKTLNIEGDGPKFKLDKLARGTALSAGRTLR